MKKRIVSIELLRILAMMMVVMLHYLSKGNILSSLLGDLSLNQYVAWGLESLSIVAVNVYMLISGYFLVESGFKPARLAELICQVLFYTLLVPVVLVALGVIKVSEFTFYDLLMNVLPVQMEQYWFISAYVIMYLFSPVLSAAAKAMSKEQLRTTIGALLLFFSVSKTVIPFQLTMDGKGYDGLWFLCVFLTAAYIRLHGISFFEKDKTSRRGLFCYGACCAAIYLLSMALRMVHLRTGKFDFFVTAGFHYNHALNLLAAVGLFYGFRYLKLPAEGMAARWICRAAPYTLGVYLLHEQVQLRTLWPGWLGASAEGNVFWFVLRALLSVLAVYLAGTLVDAVRTVMFRGAVKILGGIRHKN